MKTRLGVLFVLVTGVAIQSAANAATRDAFVRDFYAAYKAKNAARLAQFYTSDATFVDPSFELNLRGPDQIRDLFNKVFPKYESLDFEIAHTTAAADHLIVEGTMIGKLSGKTVRVPFVSIFHFREDKISAQRDMFDVTHFLVQLGTIAPPFGPKPGAASSPAADQEGTSEAASTPQSRELSDTIARMDAKIFDAFNAHNVDGLMSMFTDDLEFYQDNDGLKNYQQCFEDFKKMFGSATDIKRHLVKDSLEVYPVKDYGAVEMGAHRFCHTEDGKDECGTFQFAMVWRKTGDSWKISRVLSYGHKIRP
jgi:ketosteroid isomerase-like protein